MIKSGGVEGEHISTIFYNNKMQTRSVCKNASTFWIWEKFDGAFPSNNKKENLQRGGPRPRRERPGKPGRIPRAAYIGSAAEAPKPTAHPKNFIRPPPGLEDCDFGMR